MKKQRDYKLALICGDGAIRGGFIAGVLTRLLELYPEHVKHPYIATASSASVGSLSYYLSHGENHPGKEVWIKALSSKDFIDFKSTKDFFSDTPVYDIEYMAQTVFKKNFPLNIKAIQTSPTKFYFPVYNLNLKQVEIFTNLELGKIEKAPDFPYVIHSMANKDLYSLIQASNAAPFVYDRSVKIGEYQYIDAAAWMPILIDVPELDECKKIIIVTKRDNSLKRKINYFILGFVFPWLLKPFRKKMLPMGAYYQYGRKPKTIGGFDKRLQNTTKSEDMVYIRPSKKLGGQTDNTIETLQRNFDHGLEVVEELRGKLDQFFTK